MTPPTEGGGLYCTGGSDCRATRHVHGCVGRLRERAMTPPREGGDPLSEAVAKRRADPEFMSRLRRNMEKHKELLARLAER